MRNYNQNIDAVEDRWAGDAGYHGRHKKRSIRRAKRIASHITYSQNFLDVGCNQGLTTSYLLKNGKIAKATGVELAEDAVLSSLISNSNFNLITGDITELEIEGVYDCVFYGAVHHHIVREKGLGAAVGVFQKLVKACNGVLFFETGQLTEGGRWLWQNKLREYFSSDEEHIHYLLRSIEPYLVDFHVIGRFQIHGVWRYLLKLYITNDNGGNCYKYSDLDNFELTISRSFSRSFGSKHQRLIESDRLASDTGVQLAEATLNDERFFLKKRFRAPHIDTEEYFLSSQVDFDWAVKPVCITEKGILFPWIDGENIKSHVFSSKPDRLRVLEQLNIIWDDVSRKDVNLFSSIFCPSCVAKAIDVFDFNANNFLVVGDSSKLVVVDFEFHSGSSYSRNLLNFSRLYLHLGCYSLSARFFVKGYLIELLKLFQAQYSSFRTRVIQRQPSFVSLAVTVFRSRFDKMLLKLFPSLSEK